LASDDDSAVLVQRANLKKGDVVRKREGADAAAAVGADGEQGATPSPGDQIALSPVTPNARLIGSQPMPDAGGVACLYETPYLGILFSRFCEGPLNQVCPPTADYVWGEEK
jgi:hypothetical protein